MSQEKASDAVDYSDITEVAEEEESEKYKDALASMRPPSSGKNLQKLLLRRRKKLKTIHLQVVKS